MHNQKPKYYSDILIKIKNGDVKQRPHWQFTLQSVLVIAATLLSALIIAYLVSFLKLLTEEHEYVSAFGVGGPKDYFNIILALPWMIYLLLLVCLVIIAILVRRFSFSYTRPAIITIASIAFATAATTQVIGSIDAHKRIARFGEDKKVPGFNMLHDRYRSGKQGVLIHGIVVSSDKDSVTVETMRSSSTIQVFISSSTKGRFDQTSTNTPVFVVAKNQGPVVEAVYIGIKPPRPPKHE